MGDHRQGSDGHNKLATEILKELSANISRRWLGSYKGLEALPGVVGTAMLGVSVVEMMMSTVVRLSVLYAWKGPGLWMSAALWSTAFQVVIINGHQVGPRMGAKSGRDDSSDHGGQSWRSKPSHRRGRDELHQQKLVKKAAGRTWDGSATPAVQWGSVPRRLFVTALQ